MYWLHYKDKQDKLGGRSESRESSVQTTVSVAVMREVRNIYSPPNPLHTRGRAEQRLPL